MIPAFLLPLALLLGLKHAYDADHLVAVSSILARSPSMRRTAGLSAAWAVGHMATATLITAALFLSGQTVLSGFLEHMELAVAAMLVLIGALGILYEFSIIHAHRHEHRQAQHEHGHFHPLVRLKRLRHGGGHRAMLGIGIVHGIASNDELLLLTTTALSATSLAGILSGVAVFSVGVVLGMVLFGFVLTYPLLRWGQERVRRSVNLGAGGLSVAYGLLLFAGFGGWNPLSVFGV